MATFQLTKGDTVEIVDTRQVFDGSYIVVEINKMPSVAGAKPRYIYHLKAVDSADNEALYRRLVLDGLWLGPMIRRINGRSIEQLLHPNQHPPT